MRSRSLINLGIILLILVINWRVPEETRQKIMARPITELSPAKIHHIAITRKQSTLSLTKKKDGLWYIDQQPEVAANETLVRLLLEVAKLKSIKEYPANELNLSDIQLNPALVQLRFNDIKINFGITEQINGYRYIQIGKQVHLVKDTGLALFSTEAHYFTKGKMPLLNP
ncbi:MAG: hypothetical protein GXP22_05360 [Gammaproteobacteria bacterium]|nr:hypothetical protein [Gammaproteobacteria bacterium]